MTVAGRYASPAGVFVPKSTARFRASRETLWPLIRYWACDGLTSTAGTKPARENHFPDVGRMVVIAPRDHFVDANKMVGLDIVDVAFLSGYPT